jgi:hypothetical protein
MADIPQYVIRPDIKRVLISSIIVTAALAFIFYLGIIINVALLQLNIPSGINILIIAVLILLVLIQGLLSYLQTSKLRYAVYSNRIQIEGIKQEYILFNAVQDIQANKNFFDRIFNTGTIVIIPNMQLKAVSNFDQNFVYIKQVVQYSRNQYYQQ